MIPERQFRFFRESKIIWIFYCVMVSTLNPAFLRVIRMCKFIYVYIYINFAHLVAENTNSLHKQVVQTSMVGLKPYLGSHEELTVEYLFLQRDMHYFSSPVQYICCTIIIFGLHLLTDFNDKKSF